MMSNKKQEKIDEIDWSEFQKKYFDALTAFNSSASFINNNNFSENAFWSDAMGHWWKSIKAGSSMENQSLFEKVIEQSQQYYFMGEQFSSLIEGINDFKNKNKDASNFINKKFKEFEAMLPQNPADFSWSSFFDGNDSLFDLMKKNVSSNDAFDASNLFENVNPEMKKIRDQFLSMPGIGYNRETQEKIQKLIKLSAIYQDNNNEYQSVMAELNHKALELMRKKILRMSQQGEDINSMRQIYNLWIESNEKVYADYAFTKEFSELNGRLVNSQMALKKLSQEMNEDILSAMNMPTTRAMNELERRHYELRKKVKAMESELNNLKEIINAQVGKADNKETKTKPVLRRSKVKDTSVSNISKTTKKKKVTKKKVTKKKVTKKKVAKKKVTRKKNTKKKVKRKTRASNSKVIKIKF